MPIYFAIRLVMLLAPRVPRRVAYGICHLLGLLLWRFNRPAARVIKSNLPYLLREPACAVRASRIIQQAFINLAKDYYELVLAYVLSAERVLDEVVIADLDHVDRAYAKGRGVIAVFFHTTGFNLGLQAATIRCGRTWVVTEPLHPLPMRRLVNQLRSAHGAQLLSPDRAGLMAMTRALRANEIVALAGDRGVSTTGVWVRFFGKPAFLPAGAAALALRTQAVILPVFTSRLEDSRVQLWVGPPVEYSRTGNFDADVVSVTQKIVARFEETLRDHTEQWVVVREVWGVGPEPPQIERSEHASKARAGR